MLTHCLRWFTILSALFLTGEENTKKNWESQFAIRLNPFFGQWVQQWCGSKCYQWPTKRETLLLKFATFTYFRLSWPRTKDRKFFPPQQPIRLLDSQKSRTRAIKYFKMNYFLLFWHDTLTTTNIELGVEEQSLLVENYSINLTLVSRAGCDVELVSIYS